MDRATQRRVGILSYNTRDLVVENVEHLLAIGHGPEELIVWDNASSDGTTDALRARFPDVRSIRSPTNLGYAAGMNALVAALASRRVVLLTADCFAEAGAIEAVLDTLDATEAAVCGGRIVHARTGTIESEGGTISLPLGFALGHRKFEPADAPRGPPYEVAFVDGAFYALDVSAFHAVGGFDPMYFGYHEEVDLCWRFRMTGHRVVCDPRARAEHRTWASWGPFRERRWTLTERNRIITNLKNLEPFRLAVALLSECAYGPALLLATTAVGPRHYARAYVRALREVVRDVPSILRRRREVQRMRLLGDEVVLRLHRRIGPRELVWTLDRQRRLYYSG